MRDYVYEDIAVQSRSRNMSLGIFMEKLIHKSPRIEVYESKTFGRCLYLDMSLQACTRDEYFYHEPIAHMPMSLAGGMKRVLVIGGGDGGTLREVLRHEGVEKVVLCEINRDVVDVSVKYLPEYRLAENLKNPKVELVIGDGVKYVEDFCGEKFDVVIVDCPDPSAESSPLHSRKFFENVAKNVLNTNGAFAIQSGNAFIKEAAVRADQYELRRLFKRVMYYYSPVPSFPSGGVGFLFATNTENRPQVPFLDTKYLSFLSIAAGMKMFPKTLYESKRFYYVSGLEATGEIKGLELVIAKKFCEYEDEPKHKAFCLFEAEQALGSFSSTTFLTVDHVDEIHKLIIMLMESRGETPPQNRIFNGLTLNHGVNTYHSIVPLSEFNTEYPDLARFYKDNGPFYDSALLSYTYAGGKLVEIKSRTADISREYEVSKAQNEAFSFYGDEFYERNVKEKYAGFLGKGIDRLIEKWVRQGWKPTSLRYEKPFGWTVTFALNESP